MEGVRFENVSKMEARVISFGAPRCGLFSRTAQYSHLASTAALCVGA